MTPLRQRMVEDMMVRNLAPTTQATYVHQVSMFARYFDRSPEILGPEQIRSYQVYLATEKKLAPSSISTAVAALRFLYNETLQKHWPYLLVPGHGGIAKSVAHHHGHNERDRDHRREVVVKRRLVADGLEPERYRLGGSAKD